MSEKQATGGDKPDFTGKFRLITNENFESFLEANGANWFIRKMAASASPQLEMTQDGDKFTLKLSSMFHSRDSTFVVGETYEETQQNGVEMKVLPEWDGNRLVMHYSPKHEGQGKPQKHTREMNGDQLILTLEVDNVIAKRIFERI